MKTYCTQNNGKCSTCSLVNYGLDCANNPIPTRPIPQTRYTRMMAAYKGFAGSRTVKAVLDQIPQDLQCHLTGRELGMVMTAVNAAYHNGKAKAEAEECIWYEGGVTVDEGGQERSGVLVPKAILAHMRIEHTITLAPRDPAQVKALGGPDAYHNYKTTYHLEES